VSPLDTSALDRTIDTLATRLLAERTPAGHWTGHLASSALATAVATMALVVAGRRGGPDQHPLVRGGVGWLVTHQHEDGGWGDTTHSVSNVSTTALCWAALTAGADGHAGTSAARARAEQWLRAEVGDLAPGPLRRTLLARYGSDLTFSVPILTVLAIAGRLGEGETAWRQVPQLPFELAMLPHSWFRFVRLPVVSYALPALVAMGHVRHHRAPSRNPLLAWLRAALRGPTLGVARGMQPYSGGFLEATPLTAFVVMSLVEADSLDHPVVTHGIRFLCASARPDGSWPIDTNLATWVTTLSIGALEGTGTLAPPERERVLQWLIAQQSGGVHPFTHADPGGWAWTDLSGGVPDADDTAGALLALRRLGGAEATGAALDGIQWLLDLQNGDGGVPTFCRGWGALPFDRSAPDLTAHALRAWAAWYDLVPRDLQQRMQAAGRRATAYLAATDVRGQLGAALVRQPARAGRDQPGLRHLAGRAGPGGRVARPSRRARAGPRPRRSVAHGRAASRWRLGRRARGSAHDRRDRCRPAGARRRRPVRTAPR
jgi:squalene-hopene/tetraprenyl-beta-curcumene cyclase